MTRPTDEQALREAWERFVREGATAGRIRPQVLASWHRCRAAAVSPETATLPMLDGAQLRSHRKNAARLLETVAGANAFIENELTQGTLTAAAVDAKGCILRCWGKAPALTLGEAGPPKAGMVVREALSGTTSIALSLESGHPAYCNGLEHYCRSLHGCVDASMPVRDEQARLVGLLTIFSPATTVDGALLLSLARNGLHFSKQTRHFHDVRSQATTYAGLFRRFTAVSAEPMVLVGRAGFVRLVNPQAVRLLGLEMPRDLDRPLDQIARFNPPVADLVHPGRDLSPTDVEIDAHGASFRARVEGVALLGLTGEFLGTVLFFSRRRARAARGRGEERRTARFRFQDIIGESPLLVAAKSAARKAAATAVNVLLEGDSGTGKELFAQAIHNESERASGPFVSVNCAAIPAELIESELFGYQEGAFTGARRGGMVGKFEAANGGTIFLDEIGDMPLDVQARCLRVIEGRTVTPVGQHEEIPLDIRIIAATNKHLLREIERGTFREDLYYRLSVFRIVLPPLARCPDDIPRLVTHFVEQLCNERNREPVAVAPDVLERFAAYAWPGNVRELRNALEHAVTVDTDNRITLDDLSQERRQALGETRETASGLQKGLAEAEREICRQALIAAGGSVRGAARALGIGRATMYRKMARLGITRESILREARSLAGRPPGAG